MRRWLVCVCLALLGAAVQASVGLIELPGRADDGPVTVFYPSSSPAAAVQRPPFTFQLALQGVPVAGNRRLVVISHGSGGSPWENADLAQALVAAGFMVAVPWHQGDNRDDRSGLGPPSWKRRPLEVSHAIDAVGQDSRLAPLLALDRVGIFGMSAGGHTALVLAGGRWSPALLLKHCEAHLEDDFASCSGGVTELQGNWLDSPKKFLVHLVTRARLNDTAWYTHQDPRIKAVVAEVPFAVGFDFQSLAAPPVALGLVRAGQDLWLTPRHHIDQVIRVCTACPVLADLPHAGHGSLLSPQPLEKYLSDTVARLLRDPPGFDRTQVPAVYDRIVDFMRARLTP